MKLRNIDVPQTLTPVLSLIYAHTLRITLSDEFLTIKNRIIEKCVTLCQGFLQICGSRGFAKLVTLVIQTNQVIK